MSTAPAAPTAGAEAAAPQASPSLNASGEFTTRGKPSGPKARGGGRGGRGGRGRSRGEFRGSRSDSTGSTSTNGHAANGDATNGRGGATPKEKKKPPKTTPKASPKPEKRAVLSPQDEALLKQLKELAGAYYPEDALISALRLSNYDVQAAFHSLNLKKQKSWSSVVSKDQGAPLARTPPIEKKFEKEIKAEKAAESAPVAPLPPKPKKVEPPVVVDIDAKLRELSKKVDETLRETDTRANSLKSLQQELAAIAATRDAQIEQLGGERNDVIARNKALRDEIQNNEKRIKAIDDDVARLKTEKAAHVKELEAKIASILAEDQKAK